MDDLEDIIKDSNNNYVELHAHVEVEVVLSFCLSEKVLQNVLFEGMITHLPLLCTLVPLEAREGIAVEAMAKEMLAAQMNIIRIHPFFFPCPPHWSNILPHKKTFLLLILASFG